MNSILYLLIPIVSIISAAFLAFHDVSGWGWFIFVALMCSGSDVVKTLRK